MKFTPTIVGPCARFRMFQALCLGAVSGIALSISTGAMAQSSTLPAVTVDAPQTRARTAAAVQPSRRASTTRSARSNRAARAPQAAPVATAARVETGSSPVQGYLATVSGTGTKTDTPLSQTAQSVSVVGAEQVRDQGIANVQESLRYVPGVFAEPGGIDSRGDYPKIRGQDANIYLDGTRVNNNMESSNEWRIDPYMLERIEVFRGPASVLYGDTSTAGLINLISKRPQAEQRSEIGVAFDNFGRKQVQMDTTGKLTKDGDWLYRFVGIFRDSGTQVDFIPDDRFVLSPSLTWRPTNNTSWTVLGTYQKDKTGLTNGFLPREGTLYAGPNGYIPRNRFVGDPNTDMYKTETGAFSSLFTHDFNDAVKITQNMRFTHVEGVYRSVYSDSFSNAPDPFVDASRRSIYRYTYNAETAKDSLTSDSNIQIKAITGPVSHKMLFGVDYRDVKERSSAAYGYDTTPFDLYSPVYTSPALPDLVANPDTRQSQTGLYAQDQMRLGPWLATLGIRQDSASTRTTSATGNADTDRKATTGRASLMYETPFGFNPYVTWAQSFNPVYGGSVCLGGPCKDQRGEIYEVGFKYNPAPGIAINGAVYDTVEKNRLSVSENPLFSEQLGQVRTRGAEIEFIGKVTPDFDLIASYAYVSAKAESGDYVGKQLVAVPMNQASAWGKYRLGALGLRDVTLGAGVRYIGQSWDETNLVVVPDYTLFDLMIAYDPGPFRLQINANNIADKTYLGACYSRGDCFYGSGRTVLGTATYRF